MPTSQLAIFDLSEWLGSASRVAARFPRCKSAASSSNTNRTARFRRPTARSAWCWPRAKLLCSACAVATIQGLRSSRPIGALRMASEPTQAVHLRPAASPTAAIP